MHLDAYQFVRSVAVMHPMLGKRVLDVGSYNVNGSVRPLFRDAAEYIGIDIRPGRDVDIVTDVRDYQGNLFDVVVCCETLEHDADPKSLVFAMRDRLATDGILILTCASPERTPHGVDGGNVRDEPYTSVAPRSLNAWLKGLTIDRFEHHAARGDLYAVARRIGGSHAQE